MKQSVRFSLLTCILLAGFSVKAQDKMFTQSFAHPTDLNPALAGSIDGRYRVSIAYRDQWQSFIESPYSTFGLYGDIKIPFGDSDDFFGGGFSFVGDRTAVFNVNQNLIALFGSFHKALNADAKQYLSAGFSFGIAQRSLNYQSVFFNDQFNGLDSYSLPTSENLPFNNFGYADLGLGINFVTGLAEYSSLSVGIAADHIPGSSISFYKHSFNQDVEYPDATLDRKFTAFVSMELASTEYFSVLPRLLWQVQGKHQMVSAGAVVKFDITNYDTQALHFGGGVRLNQTSTTSLKPSAFYLMTAYEVNGLQIGLSHDIMTTNLSSLSPGRGAFELSISFTGLYENEESLCPTF